MIIIVGVWVSSEEICNMNVEWKRRIEVGRLSKATGKTEGKKDLFVSRWGGLESTN